MQLNLISAFLKSIYFGKMVCKLGRAKARSVPKAGQIKNILSHSIVLSVSGDFG